MKGIMQSRRSWQRAVLLVLCAAISLWAFPGNGSASAEEQRDSKAEFSFVWMSDTQYYSERYPKIFDAITNWIVANREGQQIKYVIHTGDIVNRWDKKRQWKRANASLAALDKAKIPYGVLAGNHDVNSDRENYEAFGKWFGASRFMKGAVYGGDYHNNRGHFDLIAAGETKFIVVYMGWGIGEQEIDWINHTLGQYPGRKAILAFHDYMETSGERSSVGEELYRKIVLKNPNVFAVLCGHNHNAAILNDEVDDNGDGVTDRHVYQLLADYQNGEKGGLGFIRLLQFDMKNDKLKVKTYSPYLNRFNYYNPDKYPGKDEFVLDLSS